MQTQTSSQLQTVPFGVDALDNSLCYAVHATADDLFVQKDTNSSSCADDTSPKGLGQIAGMFSWNENFEMSLKTGKARRLDLIGFRKIPRTDLVDEAEQTPDAAPADCPSDLKGVFSSTRDDRKVRLFSGGKELNLQVVFLATATVDLVPGENVVTLSLLRESDGSIGKKYGGHCQSEDEPEAPIETAPTSVSYTGGSFYVGTAISPRLPTFTGGTPTSYVASSSLPVGLIINSTTGAITGTPTAVTGGVYGYTITASNSYGQIVTSIVLEVLP